jgi:hypothetical protein
MSDSGGGCVRSARSGVSRSSRWSSSCQTWASPAGTGKVELGSRPVRLVEALAVAAVFDMTIDELLEDPDSERSLSRRSGQLLARRSELAVIGSLLQDRERQLDAWLDVIEAGDNL